MALLASGVLAVSGVAFAVIAWQAQVPGNNVSTPDIQPPPAALTLGVAVVTSDLDCQNATGTDVTDVTSTALFDAIVLDYSVYQGPLAASSDSGKYLCIKNVSAATSINSVAVQIGFADNDLTSTEVGACSQAEIDAGDLTCNAGDPGELASGELIVEFQNVGGICFNAPLALAAGTPANLVAPLGPGDWCTLDVVLFDANERLGGTADPIYGTDSITFPIDVLGDDGA